METDMVNLNYNLKEISHWQSMVKNRNTQSGIDNRKVFELNKSVQVYLKTDDMIFSGGYGSGLSFYIEYAKESTQDNPVVIAKGVDENGKAFEQKIAIKNINPSNATVVEMQALEAHYKVDRGEWLSSFPVDTGAAHLDYRYNFMSIFEKRINDMQILARYDLVQLYRKNMAIYENLTSNFVR